MFPGVRCCVIYYVYVDIPLQSCSYYFCDATTIIKLPGILFHDSDLETVINMYLFVFVLIYYCHFIYFYIFTAAFKLHKHFSSWDK